MNEREMQLLEKLSKAVTWKYPGNCAPGVTVSWLPFGVYYVSIVSYENGHNDKKVILSTRGETLYGALLDISTKFLSSIVVERSPIDELHDYLLIDKLDKIG